MKNRNPLIIIAILILAIGLALPGQAALLDQPMTGATAPGWVIGGAAYLTASTGVDAPGNGWLRLTEPTGNQSGFAMYDSSFDISQGVVIQFDYATWGGNGADGYSIYLFDGAYNATTFQVGASGGSLGYDKKTVAPVSPGLSGGYIGVGIDEYGNFSNPTEGRLGGPGQRQNSVAVRGPYDHSLGAYYYIGGTAANIGTLWYNQAFRPGQLSSQYRKVVIYLTPVAAPEYMRVDVFMQFGYNQPLTYLVDTLYTMRPIPSTVKVGYAASTGGSTNYHEIRNLAIDNLPININLAIAKTASAPTVAPGGALTYTVTARNYGPNLVTVANNVPIVDTVPAALTGVTWTCAGSGGGTCGAAAGSGNNINTTATLPFNGAATYTITGTVAAATPQGTVLVNTATLTPPAGIIDYLPADNSASVSTTVSSGTISISGTVYNDNGFSGGIAHNGVRDGGESQVTGQTYYAKLFRASDLSTTVVAPVQVSTTLGTYTFSGVPSYGDYVVILSSTNTVNVYDPSFPSANWIYVTPINYTLSGVVASGANLTNRNFFLYNGSRISGKVIKDDGFNGSITTAYDGILNAAETGIAGVTLTLRNSTGTTTYDTVTTDAGGNFALFTNTASATLRIYENNLAGYTSVSYNSGTTGSTYTIAGEYQQFAYTLYTDYFNLIFGDIPPPITINFTPTPLSAVGNSSTPVYYAHIFTATARGNVTFTTNSRTQGGWPAITYVRDNNCNGSFDAGESDITAAVNLEANENICILVRETIPGSATNGTIDTVVTRATYTTGLASQTRDVSDTTTVAIPNLSTSTKNWINRTSGGDPLAGDVIRYTITLTETAGVGASNVSVTDTIPNNTSGFSVILPLPGGATNLSTPFGTGGNGTGYLYITNITVPASGSVTLIYDVTIPLGTATGTVIDNSATVTVPGGIGANPDAPALIVNSGSLPGSGNKPLYFYNNSSTPSYKLSRTPMPTAAGSIVAIPRGSITQSWTLNPALQSDVTISNGNIPVTLWLSTNSNRTYTIPITLTCGGTSVATTSLSADLVVGGAVRYDFTLTPVSSTDYTCASGNALIMDITNTQGGTGTGRNINVYPAPSTGNSSMVTINSKNVININNSDITFHTALYPGGSSVTSLTVGSTVYIRATVSDPFGSYDITGATLTLTDPSGVTRIGSPAPVAMSVAYDSNAATKIYQYGPYTIPAGGPAGNWTARVVANEGTEGTVSDYALQALSVIVPMPNLLVVKSSQVFSDPVNGEGAGAKAIPGAFVDYTIQVTNFGAGAVDSNTTVITDSIPADTELFVDDFDGAGPSIGPVLFNNGTTASGLSYTFTSLASTTDNLAFSGNGGTNYDKSNTAPDINGCDSTVTNIKIPLIGIFNGSNGTNHPSFNVKFRVRIK
ncbi:MAG: hypothetical protein CVU69_03845 [Deltaproteobacteria bacterium HGW-Deltaproteobacteria-4]|nr:MAG: hypothetical protein CVU69_03845 [Deltaproteobacteria bacterium HGW-Deltaproteobacteria-4]